MLGDFHAVVDRQHRDAERRDRRREGADPGQPPPVQATGSPNIDGADSVRVLLGRGGVDLGVELAGVAHEEEGHLRVLGEDAADQPELVLAADAQQVAATGPQSVSRE